jgi:hypothetical protein
MAGYNFGPSQDFGLGPKKRKRKNFKTSTKKMEWMIWKKKKKFLRG